MYEFKYKSAATSSVEKIKAERKKLLDKLGKAMGELNPDKKDDGTESKKPAKELNEFEKSRVQDFINMYNYIKNGFNVVIEVDKLPNEEIKLKHIEKLLKKAQELNLPLNLFVSGYSKFGKESEHVDMLFSGKVMGTCIALNTYLQINGAPPLRFLEDPEHPENAWTVDQVARANSQINQIVNSIKFYEFTPFEAMAYIHFLITTEYPYKENLENSTSPRSIVGLLNSHDIVCVGYAKFIKSIVDKCNFPVEKGTLSAETVESVIKPIPEKQVVKMTNIMPLEGFAHQQNLITINDPKYAVQGSYMEDACWDVKSEGFENGKGFGNFMYCVEDAFKYDGFYYQTVKNDVKTYYATAMLLRDFVTEPKNDPLYIAYAKKSKQIPATTTDTVIINLFRKLNPTLTTEQILGSFDYYAFISRFVAASIFGENASSEYAKEGRELDEFKQQQALLQGKGEQGDQDAFDASQIMR